MFEQKSYFERLKTDEQKIVTCAHDFTNAGTVFVFNEYWISVLLSKSNEGKTFNISHNALMASRSKLFLSELLKKRGLLYVERKVLQKDEPLRHGTVVRPDCGYSGRGVKCFSSDIDFERASIEVAKECSTGMKNILGYNAINLISEPFIEGDEYSCDVIYTPSGTEIVRLCLKCIEWINGCPCNLGYLTIEPSVEILNATQEWCSAIYNKGDYSFAQFDFIQDKRGRLFLIDFSTRTGGGLNNLLSRAARDELYASAIAYSLGIVDKIAPIERHWAQYNILPGMTYFAESLRNNSTYSEYILLSNSEFLQHDCQISSINARISLIIKHEASVEGFQKQCESYKQTLSHHYTSSTIQESGVIFPVTLDFADASVEDEINSCQSSVIDKDNAKKFLSSLDHHNIFNDTMFLIQRLKTPPEQNLLDVGFGSGALLRALSASPFALYGIEKSHELYERAQNNFTFAHLFNEDLFTWTSNKTFGSIIFSFVLHHLRNPFDALKRFLPMLANCGYIYVVDRIALCENGKNSFPDFWYSTYQKQHEWKECCPNVVTRKEYEDFFRGHGFSVCFEIYPHDNRQGTSDFPKTLLLAWRTQD